MGKIFKLILLMIFVHFFLLEAFFANLEIDAPNESTHSGSAILLVIDVFVIILSTIFLLIIEIYEKYTKKKAKKKAKIATYLILLSNCIYLFYWQSIQERQIFTRSERFDNSSIVIISIYFVFELFFTFYFINKWYKSGEEK